ncbi:MAG TPA: malto-oligosyltrehalose synthase [Gaiellaceae bacterium]|nr:malto-oligosyltrehalose synthase [Gaiellaceae bacterium]
MRCTYRLQLGAGLGFREARALVPYLSELGVSHLYLSPSLQARAGSTHGYDVVDPTRISEDLGGEGEFRALCTAGLDVVLDIVPNHMAAGEENPFWPDAFDPGRRFFDIDELGGVRVEDPAVFELTHRKVLELVGEGLVEGLRVDHVDGLADPRGYLERLRDEGVRRVWVEKILEPGEELRDWPVEGTTGYEFANDVTALFVDPAGEEALTRLYQERTGETAAFSDMAARAKREQVVTTFRPEVERLRRLWEGPGLEDGLAALPVYRTYVEPWSGRVDAADRAALAGVGEELRRALLLEERGHGELVKRFQQTTGAVMAKGVEDTAFYRYHRLVALNEVGGDPGRFGLPVAEFHEANAERLRRFPRHLLATTTHDTKRSGDVRARIAAFAGLAEEWAERVRGWRALEDPNEDYLLWQTLVGAWPLERERLAAYMEKALREAKVNTTWVDPDEAHERRVREAIERLYESPPGDFEPFAARIAAEGRRNALGMTLLKLTAPGVPDVYQGDEVELLALVDPDNRRPVDWERRRRALLDPPPKLRTILAALDLRRRRPRAFEGAYEPLEAGPSVCAFERGGEVRVAVPIRPGAAKPAFPGWHDVLPELPVGLYER